MSQHFACDNPKCKFHIEVSEKQDEMPYFRYREPYLRGVLKDIEVQRYAYSNGKGYLFLCEICHSAVQLITTGNSDERS